MEMKKTILLLLLSALLINLGIAQNFHSFKAQKINGDSLDFSTLSGKKVLVVNTASFCGYTSQYSNLQNLYETYGGPDFEIIAFPANNFLGQEPNSDAWIANFVDSVYSVTFTMMSKISVSYYNYNSFPSDTNNATPAQKHEIYQWLTEQSNNGVMDAPVQWNFQKFLISEQGELEDMVAYSVNPETSTVITDWLSASSIGENPEKHGEVTILTNPVRDNIMLECPDCGVSSLKISIYNAIGQQVQKNPLFRITGSGMVIVPAADLQKGVYFIQISDKGFSKTLKISKI